MVSRIEETVRSLLTFLVGRNQSPWKKPTTFGRALTDSLHKCHELQLESNLYDCGCQMRPQAVAMSSSLSLSFLGFPLIVALFWNCNGSCTVGLKYSGVTLKGRPCRTAELGYRGPVFLGIQ